eukprot:6430924-Prorocentrum_lima.AAC.1
MGTNIKRAKKEPQQEMSSSSTWSWPQAQQRYKGNVLQRARERESSHRLLEPGKKGRSLIPV